jgi:hypothetical protein
MKRFPCLTLLLVSTALAFPWSSLQSAEADPDLPQAFNPAVADSLLAAPPFTRALDLSDSLVLTGIAYIEGKPVATVLNKQTKENFIVSEVPNAQGWRLAETSATVQLNRTQAKIMVGSEIVTIRYSDEQLTPESMKKGGFKPGGSDGRDDRRRDDGPRRERRGPSEEDRKKFESLSSKAREKFIQEMRDSREKMQNATSEERSAYVKKVFERVEKEDKGGN